MPSNSGGWLGLVEGNDVSVVRVSNVGLSERILLGRHEGKLLSFCDADPFGHFLATVTLSGQIKLWDATGERAPTTSNDMRGVFYSNVSKDGSHFFGVDSLPQETAADMWIWSINDLELSLRRRIPNIEQKRWPAFDPVGLRLAMLGPVPATRVWSLGAPNATDPILLRRGRGRGAGNPVFSPDGRWLATYGGTGLTLWPLARPDPAVIRLDLSRIIGGLEFGPNGNFLVSAADARVSIFPLDGEVPTAGHTVFEVEGTLLLYDLAISPDGKMFAVTDTGGKVWIGKDDGKGAELIHGLRGTFVDFSPDGGFLGLVNFETPQTYAVVWEVEAAREVARFHLDDGEIRWHPSFGGDGRLMTGTSKGVLAWDIETGNYEILADADVYGFISNEDGRQLLVTELGEGGLWGDPEGPAFVFDLDAGVTTHLETHGTQVWAGAVNQDGTVVATGGPSGIIRVGPVTGEEPHLLFRHDGAVQLLAIDPLGRWIASAGADNTIRIWPMPDLSKPPLHTLPRSELIAKLETLTNTRLVRDPESSTGWKFDYVPFQGWETVPTW